MNYLFDFDGTICDSFDLTIKIANEFFKKYGKKIINPNELRENGIESVIKESKLNKIQILIYVLKGRSEIAKHISELQTFSGIKGELEKLSKGNTLGIVSSNSKNNIDKFLKQNGLENIFKFIYSSPTIFDKHKKIDSAINKYKLDRKETVYIGDEVRDIEAAHKAKIKCISVSWGFASKALLAKNSPDLIINDAKEISRHKFITNL